MKCGKKVKLIKFKHEPTYYGQFIGKIGEIIEEEDTGLYGKMVLVKLDDGSIIKPYTFNLELVENIIKKSQLKGGDIVTYRNRDIRIIDENNKKIVYLNDFTWLSFYLDDFDEDLMYKSEDEKDKIWDIVEVYRPTTKETFITERKKETKKMTVAQICEELGYDIEIIKEDN